MIAEHGSVRDLLAGEQELGLRDHVVHWRGLAYLPEVVPGAASLAACDWSSGLEGVLAAARALKGSYVLSVMEREGGRHFVFTDAGGHLPAFLAGGVASTSFLRLCEATHVGFSDLDPLSVAMLLDVGTTWGLRTPAPAIRSLAAGHVYELLPDAPARVHDAAVPAIDVPPQGVTIERFFGNLSASLQGMQVSVDLTGGADSRLVAALLVDALDFECAISGVQGNSDIEIARKVARVLGRPLHVLHHEVGDIDAVVPELFDLSDGLLDMLNLHRLRQNAMARCSRGVQVALGGHGGEAYKDYWWLQDFPRYRSARSDLDRFFNLRTRPVALPPGLLTGAYAEGAARVREHMLGEMRERVMPLNTQTYDRIVNELKRPAGASRFLSMNTRFLPFDAPLIDPELLRLAFALPRSERFFNRFHRRVLTGAHGEAARLRSNEGGMSLSAHPLAKSTDAVAFVGDRVHRLARKIRQRVEQAPLRQERPDHPGLVPAARGSRAFGTSVRRLRDKGVLAASVDAATVPDRYVGRVMTLGLLAERLDG